MKVQKEAIFLLINEISRNKLNFYLSLTSELFHHILMDDAQVYSSLTVGNSCSCIILDAFESKQINILVFYEAYIVIHKMKI